MARKSQRGAEHVGVARVVIVADRQGEVIERGQRVAVSASKRHRLAARFVSLTRLPLSWAIARPRRRASSEPTGSALTDGPAVGLQRKREDTRVAGRFGGLDQAVRGGHRLVIGTANRQCHDAGTPVVFGCTRGVADRVRAERGTTDPPLRLADGDVGTANKALRRRTGLRRGHCSLPFGRPRCSRTAASIRPAM